MIAQLFTDCARKHPGGSGLPLTKEGQESGSRAEPSRQTPARSGRSSEERISWLGWIKNPSATPGADQNAITYYMNALYLPNKMPFAATWMDLEIII